MISSTAHPLLLAALVTLGALSSPAVAAPRVIVSSEKDDALTLVDATTLAVQRVLPTCKRPRHMQRTPDGKRLLVACAESNAADVIDLATLQSVGRLALGPDPEAFDLSPDGKTLFVSNEDDGELGFIDIASGKKLKAVAVGKEPEGVKVAADGKTVYVSSEAASLVHVIDIASAKVTKNIQVGKRPRRMALTPDGAELWVTNELDASLSIISTRDHSVLHTLRLTVPGVRAPDITPVGIVMARDGRRAFVGLGRANHVAFIDVRTRQVTHRVLAGKRAWNVALDAAQARLYVVNGLSDDMTVIDVATAKPLKTVPVGRVPYQAVVVE